MRGRNFLLAMFAMSGCYVGLGTPEEAADEGGSGDDGPREVSDKGPLPDIDPLPAACAEIGRQPLRRVSSYQYANILRDLLPREMAEDALAVSVFPPTRVDSGFSSFATANTVNSTESNRIEDNAELVASLLLERSDTLVPALVPCVEPGFAPAELDGCIDGFIAEFGERAFRRPLSAVEAGLMRQTYDAVSTTDGPIAGLAAVVQFILQAPPLLYAVEHGRGSDGTFVALTPYELATRLAMFLRDSMPDDALMAAAREGRLETRDDVEAQARRLLEEVDLVTLASRFHTEWFGVQTLETATRTHELWTSETRAGLLAEMTGYTRWLLEEADGTYATLMTAEDYPIDPRLEPIYASGGPRKGVLTLASVMASQSHEDRTSLIERAVFLRNEVLCAPTPPFPGNVATEAVLGPTGHLPTARERLAPLLEAPECAGCHQVFNPLGFPFEVYDWVGSYRATENETPIDTRAELAHAPLTGTYDDAIQLVDGIAQSSEGPACYARKWFEYAVGRPVEPADACVVEKVQQAFAASGGDIRELLVAIATSDAFLYRPASGNL